MYLFFVVIFVLLFSKNFACLATPTNIAAPEIPISFSEAEIPTTTELVIATTTQVFTVACTTCGALPLLAAPETPTTTDSTGSITQGVNAQGCISYTVTCNAFGNNAIIIGANQAAIQLSGFTRGQKTAQLICNDQGQIAGTTTASMTIIATSIYCSRAK